MPCHHNLEEYLIAYLDGAGLRSDPKGPLFRTIGRGTGKLTRTVLPQANAYAMIRRRAAAAGIQTKLGNHSFRATRITAYLKNGGTLEKATAMANQASTRTTQLYDRLVERCSAVPARYVCHSAQVLRPHPRSGQESCHARLCRLFAIPTFCSGWAFRISHNIRCTTFACNSNIEMTSLCLRWRPAPFAVRAENGEDRPWTQVWTQTRRYA
jgi:hypothetical protein